MAVVLFFENRQLPNKIKSIFNESIELNSEIYIPANVISEIAYLKEKGRIDISVEKIVEHCYTIKSFKIENLTIDIILKNFEIKDIPEPHDRLIAGTAYHLKNKLITNDPIIRRSKHITSIWD